MSDVAGTTVRQHRLAAACGILTTSSLASGLALAARHPVALLVGFGAAALFAVAARRYVYQWQVEEHRSTSGLSGVLGCLQPQFVSFHARRGGLPVVPALILQLIPIVLLAASWIALALAVLVGALGAAF